MITFANPAWLYGLLGLLIPIGIHLLSRKEGKTIYIGSIRHLTDSDTAQFSSIRLNEIVLLILRLVLLALLVLILAGFSVELGNKESRRWLVIEKGIERNQDYKGLIDSIKTKAFEVHWLADNFPKYEDSSRIVTPSNYYKLTSQIQYEADTAVVVSYGYANRFRGEKTPLPSSVKWLTVEPDERRLAVQAIRLAGDSVLARMAKSNSEGTLFEYSRFTKIDFEQVRKIDSFKLHPVDTIDIAIFAAPEFDYDKKIVQAAIHAIANGLSQKFNISILGKSSQVSDKSDFVFWLSGEPCQLKETTVIGYANCSNFNLPLVVSKEKSETYCDSAQSFDWILSKRLNEENALEESLAFSLAKILLNDISFYKNETINAADQRSITAEAAFTDGSPRLDVSSNVNESHAGSEPPLLILLFLVLIAERYVAYKRNQ